MNMVDQRTVTHANYDPWPEDATLDQLCKETGLPRSTLTDWTAKRYVRPWLVGKKGRGHPHIFAQSEAFAIRATAAIVLSERGCKPEFVPQLLQLLSKVPLRFSKDLIEACKKNRDTETPIHKAKIYYNRVERP